MKLFEKIPSSMMAVTVVMAALAPLVFVVAKDSQGLMVVWMGIYIAVGVIAGLGAYFFERSKKDKAEGFSKGVEQNAASAEGVKDPNKIAQIDHMRKEFQRGIDIYKRYGKDLYSLPWYVVVGESGSGKTEALRRSEIGFPEKLQDKWQGSGGTLSMHWWFTSKAVILDTAGRLFVQDGLDGEGGQSQWVSFLQMLRKNRPDCPINGLILVIPATRLLSYQDPEREAASLGKLDENAGQISRQMETLQTELGIRFPVYIMVSKTDQITGFREFFSGIDRADERYQMLGWSNPASLGETFSPQSVADYIQSVSDRLKRRLMSDLRNPEPETAHGLRIGEVNALYSFPSSFASMAPKLSRYLKQVFAADEWSAKPPFLRGIYFTSALQQGRVLDEAVAKALGIPLESMDGSGTEEVMSLTKNRTYFVRDLFLEKIFKEKGLVTKSDKVRAEISGWKLWLPACFVLGLLLFGAMGWFTNRPGPESAHWTSLFELKSDDPKHVLKPLVRIDAKNRKVVWNGPGDKQIFDVLGQLGQDVKSRPKFGWVFVPAQWFDGSLKLERENAYTNIVARVFGDLIKDVSPSVMNIPAEDMKGSDWKAIEALLLFKYGKIQGNELLTPGGGKDKLKVEAVVADLVNSQGMGDSEENKDSNVELLSSVVSGASSLAGGGFSDSFSAQLSDLDLAEPIMQLFKSGTLDDMADFKKAIEAISAKYGKILKSLKPGGTKLSDSDILSLADDISRLRKSYPNQIEYFGNKVSDQGEGSKDDEKDKKLDPKEDFRKWIKDNDPSDIMGLGALNKSDPSSKLDEDAENLLLDESKLLNGIFAALSPAGNDGLFSVEEVDAVLKIMEEKPEAGDVDSARIGTLRKWWFEKYFYPTKFRNYLKFPLVKDEDGKAGTADDLYISIRLISLAEKSGYGTEKIKLLVDVTEALFDLTKLNLTNLKNSSAVRKCMIGTRDAGGLSVRVEIWGKSGRLGAIDTGVEANPKPRGPISLDEPLEFKIGGQSVGEKPRSWCIVQWRFSTEKEGWMKSVNDSEGKGLIFDISASDVELPDAETWPRLSDFAPPP